ncbi:MAG: UpxY family transcription antiterminator [Chitinophagaceae bacterium]|nr:UpxY family transcription antiterminator [Chitinophagaceae bacterium]
MNQWYAVYTKPNCERKIGSALSKKKIIHYIPLLDRSLGMGKKFSSQPLFRSYIFVSITKEEAHKVLQIPGVINFIYWLGEPVIIRDVEIEIIQRFLAQHKRVSVEEIEVKRTECVRIISFTEDKNHLRIPPMEMVKVTLPSLGFALVGEKQKENIKVVLNESMAV